MRSATWFTSVMLALTLLLPAGAHAMAGSEMAAAPVVDATEFQAAPGVARGWQVVEQAFGVGIHELAARVGLGGVSAEDLPAVPWAVTHALRTAAGSSALDGLAGSSAEDTEEPGDEPSQTASPARVSATPLPDVTGDGVDDLWLVNAAAGRDPIATLVDGAEGAVLWQQGGAWSSAAPVPSGDVDGDGVVDLAVTVAEVLGVEDIADFEGEYRESGFTFTMRTGVAMLSGATGEQLWDETDVETFGFSFYGRYTTTDYAFGLRIVLGNTLLSPVFLERAGDDELIVQRVDQRASAEVGGTGAYVWSDDPSVSGVQVSDYANVDYSGATRARLVSPADNETRRTFRVDPGEQVGFLLAARGAESDLPDTIWATLALPRQRFECVAVHCLETPAANRTMTVSVFDPAGALRWHNEWAGRFSSDLWYGHDVTGDGLHDIVLEEVLPAGESFDFQLAAVDGTTGEEHWRSQLGAISAGVQAIPGSGRNTTVLVTEVQLGSEGLALVIRRVGAATGAVGRTTVHDVEYPERPSEPVGLDDEPYVWAISSWLGLDVGGDTDGDGVEDLLVSLAQDRAWSDERETHWGQWTVESARTGDVLHQHVHEERRTISGWADTSGDGSAEFLEHTSSTVAGIVRDGRSGDELWQLDRQARVTPLHDVDDDGATDLLSITSDGAAGNDVAVLDGRSRRVIWTLRVPRD